MNNSRMLATLGQPKEPMSSYPPRGAAVKIQFGSSETSITAYNAQSGWRGFSIDASFRDWKDGSSEYSAKLQLGSWDFLKKLRNREVSFSKWEGLSDEEFTKKINGTINGFITTILHGYNAQIEAINQQFKVGLIPYFTEERMKGLSLFNEKGQVDIDVFDSIFDEDEFVEWLIGKEFIFIIKEGKPYTDKNGETKTSNQPSDPMKPFIVVNKEWTVSSIFTQAYQDVKVIVTDPNKGIYQLYEEYLATQSNPYSKIDDVMPY